MSSRDDEANGRAIPPPPLVGTDAGPVEARPANELRVVLVRMLVRQVARAHHRRDDVAFHQALRTLAELAENAGRRR